MCPIWSHDWCLMFFSSLNQAFCVPHKCSLQTLDDMLLNNFLLWNYARMHFKFLTFSLSLSAEKLIVCITRREFPTPAYCPCWASDLITSGTIATNCNDPCVVSNLLLLPLFLFRSMWLRTATKKQTLQNENPFLILVHTTILCEMTD